IELIPEAITRARNYLDAGADCVYPIFLRDEEAIGEFVTAVAPAPVNVSFMPDGQSIERLAELGVARISLGGGLWRLTQSWLTGRLDAIKAGQSPY
ncbi:MAG: isocitrate lyase/phosphoenolpyruvate mutase family protein, partial [Sciscionella sp.]|nr:isocitrate lyase/phosphoenolpyruvate mutase family protein [Sciscionella sp.]